mmetsp:Transcript_82813/g.229967  ORF Transcript_82813/g.229967 Transcript_82813/m.229967 type:complete len:252 (-) Transcript_82813:783-1538(-)
MEVRLVRGQRLELGVGALQVALGLGRLELGIRRGLRLLGHGAGELRDHGVGVLHKLLVVCLCPGLTRRGLGLELLRVLDDLLEQTHNRRGACVCLVLGELRLGRLGAALGEGNLVADAFAVEVLQPQQGLLQNGLGGPLVGDCRLEFGILLLAGTACLLDLSLHLCDLGVRMADLLLEAIHGVCERINLGLEVLLVLALAVCCLFVFAKLLFAIGLEICFFSLLALELCNHLVDHLLHLTKGVQLYHHRQR